MELRQLKYFIAVAENLHFGKAAEKLFISQPALTQQIKLLETELGTPLFDLQSRKLQRKVKLTQAGELLLEEAKPILELVEQAKEKIKNLESNTKLLRLGIYKALLKDRIIEITAYFAENFPLYELSFVEFENYGDVQAALEKEVIDIGLTILPILYDTLAYKVLKKGKLCCIYPTQLNGKECSVEELLVNEKWIELKRDLHPVFNQIEQVCANMRVHRNIVQEVSSLSLLISLVGLGKGVAFIPTLYDLSNEKQVTSIDLSHTPFDAIEICHVLAFKKTNTLIK